MRVQLIFMLALIFGTPQLLAVDMGSIVKAQVVLGQVGQVIDKYEQVQALIDQGKLSLDVAEPINGASGKYMLPFDADGNLTPWADKALNAQAGSAVAGAAGGKAIDAVAGKVPFGGLMSGAFKSKAKETGAVVAIGGWEFIKENTAQSFNKLDEYAVYLHDAFNGTDGYDKALAAAMAIYPKLEKNHRKYIDRAYKDARKRARKLKG